MIYNELYDDFIKLFPEDDYYFREKEAETGAEREDGMHIMFALIICPFILKIATEDSQKTQKAFDFIEKMECDENSMVVNVAEVTILENIMTDDNGGMKKFGRFLGKESLKSVKYLSHFFKIEGVTEYCK